MEGFSPHERELLNRFKRWLEEELGDEFVRAVVFGSAARGERHEESDIDVLVLIDGDRSKRWRPINHYAVDIFLDEDVYISPLVMTIDHYNWLKSIERRLPFDIEREGIVL